MAAPLTKVRQMSRWDIAALVTLGKLMPLGGLAIQQLDEMQEQTKLLKQQARMLRALALHTPGATSTDPGHLR